MAEFQAQLSLLLDSDRCLPGSPVGASCLTDADVSSGLSLWHLGVLVSVLAAGRLYDRAGAAGRIVLCAGPLVMHARTTEIVVSLCARHVCVHTRTHTHTIYR